MPTYPIVPPPPQTASTALPIRTRASGWDVTPADMLQQQRNEDRARSRSPGDRRDRSRSRSRERVRESRRNRSPNGYYDDGDRAASYERRGAPQDRGASRDQRMSEIRESSQQDRRVYVGNLPYEVKWHDLKNFMREGNHHHHYQTHYLSSILTHFTAGDVLFADVLLLPNGMSKVMNIVAREPGFLVV